jgi:hypothetical protein
VHKNARLLRFASHHASPVAALLAGVLLVVSCQSHDAAAPSGPAIPSDSAPRLSVTLPLGAATTARTADSVVLHAANLKPNSCSVSGPPWLGLTAGKDSNAVWSLAPTDSGAVQIVIACRDVRNGKVGETDSLHVYAKPTVTPDISGMVPVQVGDSIDVTYDSTDTRTVDVICQSCGANASVARAGANTIRFFAKLLAISGDTARRGICFTIHGLDGRYTEQDCVSVVIMPVQPALYSVPQAIRNAEVIALHNMPVATYDNSGQSNHPDFMRVNAAWSGNACWMVFTPYPLSNGSLENPSLATSSDCEHWAPAPGVRAPLVDKPAAGYNSDPELIFDARHGCLAVVFRQVIATNIINITNSCDGHTWNTPRQLFAVPNHSAVSPTVSTGPDGVNRIWYVDATAGGCNTQTSSVKMRVGTPDTTSLDSTKFGSEVLTDLVQPGYVIWHLKIRWIPQKQQYWAMYAAFPQTTGIGNCTTDDLFMATSSDGMHWQSFRAPIIDHLDRRFNFVSLYRASFQYYPSTDNLRVITSALDETRWGQFAVAFSYSSLMNALNSSLNASISALVAPPKLVRPFDLRLRPLVVEDRP